jgi:hypothetical protein
MVGVIARALPIVDGHVRPTKLTNMEICEATFDTTRDGTGNTLLLLIEDKTLDLALASALHENRAGNTLEAGIEGATFHAPN